VFNSTYIVSDSSQCPAPTMSTNHTRLSQSMAIHVVANIMRNQQSVQQSINDNQLMLDFVAEKFSSTFMI